MTDYQFEEDRILIQPYASAIGAFTFDLGPQLPDGDDISSVSVAATLDGADSSSDLISSSSHSQNVVSVYLKYPGSDKHGTHKLTFKYTLDSGAKDEADFWCVEVVDS